MSTAKEISINTTIGLSVIIPLFAFVYFVGGSSNKLQELQAKVDHLYLYQQQFFTKLDDIQKRLSKIEGILENKKR